ncbi:hypothetical protein EYV94_00785 [Puteibacter caeruleilacunae]|nr:hypothetical protein EYV94_00785 [Puteibacter caeruleilacunae]
MLSKLIGTLLCAMCLIVLVSSQEKNLIENDFFKITLDKEGKMVELLEKRTGKNILLPDYNSFLTVRNKGVSYPSTSWTSSGELLKFNFGGLGAEVKVKMVRKSNYITFEIIEVKSETKVEKVVLGPYHVLPSQKIGKSIGIAYDDNCAIGLMGLNLKSRGGFEIVNRERFGNAAKKIEGGASLTGFVRNRSYERVVDNYIQKKGQAVPVNDGDAKIEGARYALYCVPTSELRAVIEKITKEENLPYIKTDGVWNKVSKYSSSSKFIISYNVENIDACIDIAKKAGITCVYHGGIFKTWGHFEVDDEAFPNGYSSVRVCSEKAAKSGINLGAHTLTNFITTSDSYISPKPHADLALAGVTRLGRSVSKTDTELLLEDEDVRSAYYDPNRREANPRWLKHAAVKIGNEIIEYVTTTTDGKLTLIECKRGAFGTKAEAHNKGEKVGRLISHGYKVFFPNINLQDEMAINLARFFNETKLKRISFDGIEGGLTSGHGRYGCDRFVKVFFDNLKDPNILANSSDVTHFGWHYFANESWGEPWTSKNFREAHLSHRLNVQKSLKEDLLPRKMGQFRIDKNTTVQDIEWVMGLCAGYDAGVDFYISPNFEEINKEAISILAEIKKWEEARMKGMFSEKQKEKLRDPFTFYGLIQGENGVKLKFIESWAPESGKAGGVHDANTLSSSIMKTTQELRVSLDYKHTNMITEPGQPTASIWEYFCAGPRQELQYVIRLPKVAKEAVKGIYLRVGAQKIAMPFVLEPGDYIVHKDSKFCLHYSKDHQVKSKMKLSENCIKVSEGKNLIEFDYKGKGRVAGPEVIVNFCTKK